MSQLKEKLGPVLLQLPPTLRGDPVLLADALDAVPSGVRTVVEPRHDSWLSRKVEAVLVDHGAVLCAVDRRSVSSSLWTTAGWGYVRLHEGTADPLPCYGDSALRSWVARVVATWGDGDVYVLFNNDHLGCAVANAARICVL